MLKNIIIGVLIAILCGGVYERSIRDRNSALLTAAHDRNSQAAERKIKALEMTLAGVEKQRDLFQDQARDNFLDLQEEKRWHADKIHRLEQYKNHLWEVETRILKAGYKISEDPKWPEHFVPSRQVGKTQWEEVREPRFGPGGGEPIQGFERGPIPQSK